jgi:hypothetical protein
VGVANGEIVESSFSIARTEPFFLEVDGYGPGKLRVEAEDLFECLAKLRLDLEKDGAKVLCNGARADAFPSGMAREMSGGKKVYLLRMGEPANPNDLVNTFDEAPVDKIASVADQREYYLAWVKSCAP